MRHHRARWNARQRTDDGSATAETVAAMPLLLLLIFVVVQFGVWAHANHVAQATASEALAAVRLEGASAADGYARAAAVRHQIGPRALADTSVTVARTTDTATVQVTGTAPRVIPVPFLKLTVHARASGPVERFRPGADGLGLGGR
ncbi:TadE/TadG family type IV pilus assembly protein [Spirillospora sp. NPDC047279]|uniref:TadE/TadG family type IV pilus assembly protein n=1 Tax=Spirillospora sp. NPDC047279 TaxID=3155478 RepID=UPI0033F3FE7F